MKKLLCMILALIMVLSLCACGQDTPNTNDNANNQTNQNGENNTNGNGATSEPSEEILDMMKEYKRMASALKNYVPGEEPFSFAPGNKNLYDNEGFTYIYQRLSEMEALDAWYGSEWMPKDDPDTEWNRQKLLAGFSAQKDSLLKLSCVITTQTEDIKTFEDAYVWEYNPAGKITKVSFVDMLYTNLCPFWLDIPTHTLYKQNLSGKDYFESMSSLTFTYDENGNMVKIKRHGTTEEKTRDLINLERDASGKLVGANSVDEDGNKKNLTFTYDAQGRLNQEESNSSNGYYQYTYNENGQLLQVEFYRESPAAVLCLYKYTYDTDGKLTKVEYSGTKNKMVEVTFTYDDQGRPATVSYSEGYFPLKYGQTLDFSKVEFQYVYGDYFTYVPAK